MAYPGLSKRSSRSEIDYRLSTAAQLYRYQLSQLEVKPANFSWIAATLHGQLQDAAPAERSQLYWSIAVVCWAAKRKDLARMAVKAHLRLRPPTELDKKLAAAREKLRKALLAMDPAKVKGSPDA